MCTEGLIKKGFFICISSDASLQKKLGNYTFLAKNSAEINTIYDQKGTILYVTVFYLSGALTKTCLNADEFTIKEEISVGRVDIKQSI